MSEQAREVLNDAEMALQGMKANVAKSEKDFEVIAKAVAERDGWQAEAGRWRKVAGEQAERLVKADAYIAELERWQEEAKVMLGKWDSVDTFVRGDPRLTIGDSVVDACYAALVRERQQGAEIELLQSCVVGLKTLAEVSEPQKVTEDFARITEDCGNVGLRGLDLAYAEQGDRKPSKWDTVIAAEAHQKILDELFAGLDDGIDVSGDSHKVCGAAHPIVDMVNQPPHYQRGSVECIDAIQSALTEEEFRGYCKGNAMKYCWRERHKGGSEDLKKAVWYLERGVR